MKKHSPHALFVHCHCHQLQLACVQAANGTADIEHVYVTLTTLWKFFYYSPKCAQSLKEVQKVLNFPELKIVKPSDTRWLAHERCVRPVKASYSAIITALDHIYNESHEPEALGIKKALCKKSTIAAIYLLDYVLPQVTKLSRALQTENLDLSMISSLLDATLHSIDCHQTGIGALRSSTRFGNSNRGTNNSRGYIHFSRENRPVLHSSVEGQHYKPFYLLRRGEFLQHL